MVPGMSVNPFILNKNAVVYIPLINLKNAKLKQSKMSDHLIDCKTFISVININCGSRLITKILNSAFSNFNLIYRLFM